MLALWCFGLAAFLVSSTVKQSLTFSKCLCIVWHHHANLSLTYHNYCRDVSAAIGVLSLLLTVLHGIRVCHVEHGYIGVILQVWFPVV